MIKNFVFVALVICIVLLDVAFLVNADCPYEEYLIEHGRSCRKDCSSDSDCKGKKRCMCDGPCGMTCFYDKSDCGEPQQISNGRVEREHTLWSAQATYSCDDGYALNSSAVVTCHSDRKWYPAAPTCKLTCSLPRDAPFSYQSEGETEFVGGKSYHFSCNTGYYMSGSPYRECLETGSWSSARYTCYIIECDSITPVRYGIIHYSDDRGPVFGATATVECRTGYRESRTGLSMRCFIDDDYVRYGIWKGNLPTCEIISCVRPEEPEDGRLVENGNKFDYGRQIHFECNNGYKIKGSSTIQCNEDERWSDASPHCIVDPSCNFENFDNQVCGFRNVQNKWKRQFDDHRVGFVLGSGAGGYSYLISKRIPQDWTTESSLCLEFDYKISEYSTLSVENANSEHKYWKTHPRERTGLWLDALVDINIGTGIQFQFKSSGEVVQLDNVAVNEGDCENHCEGTPCHNGGTCINRKATSSCICTVDFTGETCDIDRKCPELPGTITNGKLVRRDRGLRLPGKRAQYICNDGHKFSHVSEDVVDEMTITCVQREGGRGESEWNMDPTRELSCEVVTCEKPQMGISQKIVSSKTRWIAGDKEMFRCIDGFYFDPVSSLNVFTRRCQLDGQWSGVVQNCIRRFCTLSGRSSTPIVVFPRQKYNVGIKIKIDCRKGYRLSSSRPNSYLTCTGQDRWDSRDIPRCEKITCGKIPEVAKDVSPVAGVLPKSYGETFTYRGCHRGWSMIEPRTITCKSDENYSQIPRCRKLGTCPNRPTTPANAEVQHGSNMDRNVRYECTKMYNIIGNKIVACESVTRQWTASPKCEEIQPNATTTYNGIQYLIYLQDRVKSNYADAQQLCRSINGDLAILYSETVVREFNKVLPDIQQDFQLRIGLRRVYKRGCCAWSGYNPTQNFKWDWTNGESKSNLPDDWTQFNDRNWAYGRYDESDCVVVDSRGDWNKKRYAWKKLSCDENYSFVCQRNFIPCEPNPCTNGGTCRPDRATNTESCRCHPNFYGDRCENEYKCDTSTLTNMKVVFGTDTEYPVGSRVSIGCADGYVLERSDVITCGRNGIWDIRARCREITCRQPELPVNVRFSGNDNIYKAGRYYKIKCNAKYKLLGDTEMYCGWDEEWAQTTTLCEKIECGAPLLPSNAIITRHPQNYEMGANMWLGCLSGFTQDGNDYAECDENGRWTSISSFRCIPRQTSTTRPRTTTTTTAATTTTRRTTATTTVSGNPCEKFPDLPQGSYIIEDPGNYPSGTTLEIGCEKGRELVGSSLLTCNDGTWNKADDTECELLACKLNQYLLPPGIEAEAVGTFSVGQTVTLTCSGVVTHYEHGDIGPEITCQRGGGWDPYPSGFICS